MKYKSFLGVVDRIEEKLAVNGWKTVDRTAGLLVLRALDTANAIRHEIIFGHPFKYIDLSGGPWIGISCDTQILFEKLEATIAEKLNRNQASNVSAIFGLALMAPEPLFYAKNVFPINTSSADSMKEGVDHLLSIYSKFVEPQRKALTTASCFDDPGYYPHDSVSPLTWELRRAARYSMTKTSEEYNVYINGLMVRINDYVNGLGNDQSIAADAARRTISEIRQFVENSKTEVR